LCPLIRRSSTSVQVRQNTRAKCRRVRHLRSGDQSLDRQPLLDGPRLRRGSR
jgi:hypothetical protein